MKNPDSIRSLFSMSGFVAAAQLSGVFGDRYARVIQLRRRKKRLFVRIVGIAAGSVMTRSESEHETCQSPVGAFIWNLNAGEFAARSVTACM